jgi:hypothetical protein
MCCSWFHTHIVKGPVFKQATSLTHHGSEWGCIQAATDRNFSSLSLTTSQRSRELRASRWNGTHSRSVTLLLANPLILCKKCGYVLHKVKWNQRVHLWNQGCTCLARVNLSLHSDLHLLEWDLLFARIYLTLEVLSFGIGNPWFGLKMGCLIYEMLASLLCFITYSPDTLQCKISSSALRF